MTAASKPGDPADKAADGVFGGQPTGSHRAGYGETLARVEAWLRAHPSATLASGEGWALVEEIDRMREEVRILIGIGEDFIVLSQEADRLREQLRLTHIEAMNETAENSDLRAAIDRVRALHQPTTVTFTGKITGETWNECDHCRDDNGFRLYHPCPTLRALDGEDA